MSSDHGSRLRELAKKEAIRQHSHAVTFADINKSSNGHVSAFSDYWGFDTCPHPDCALLRASASAPPDDKAWLVELGSMPPQWWTGRRKNGHEFSADANDAMRFARREDAEGAIGHLVKDGTADGCKATEHVWMEKPDDHWRDHQCDGTNIAVAADGRMYCAHCGWNDPKAQSLPDAAIVPASALSPEPASQLKARVQTLAQRVTCSEVHEGTLCKDCQAEGAGCLRAWAVNGEWPVSEVAALSPSSSPSAQEKK